MFPNLTGAYCEDHLSKSFTEYREKTDLTGYFLPKLFKLNNVATAGGVLVLDAHLQSWKYFNHLDIKTIKDKLAFNEKIENKITSFLEYTTGYKKASTFYIGVHIRRGDFTEPHNQKLGFHISSAEYIHRGIWYIINKSYQHQSFVIIICTNDMPWAKANIPADYGGHVVVFSPFSSPADDLCLLSHCNGSVITGGTYGWWGAYLAAGPVVYDRLYPTKGSRMDYYYNKTDYYPESWIPL